MNPNQAIIRVMPQSVHGGLFGNPMRTETFYDLSGLAWNARSELIKELEAMGYFVQQLWMDDIMPIQIGMEIRRKEAERIAKEKGAK